MHTLPWRESPPSRRILTLATYAMALAGTVLLCLGTGDFTLAFVVGCAACLSFYLTEWTGLLRLGALAANAAAAVAMVIAGFDFLQGGREGQLIAIANLLVYLQIILLFQEKTVRVYWHIFLLSLLQVVVGAALSLSASFGLMLVGFIALAVFTLHAFFLINETGLFTLPRIAPSGAARDADRSASRGSLQSDARLADRRWPYSGRPMTLSAVPLATHHRTAVGVRRLATTTAGTLAFSLPVALLVFFCVPRMGRDPWRGGTAAQQRVVGFSQEVRLGELGAVAEDSEVVMRVKFLDPRSGRGFPLENTPMLRGSVVTRYERGKWTHHGGNADDSREHLEPPPLGQRAVTQEISLEPLNEPVVFSVYPPYARSEQPVAYDTDRQQLVREPEMLERSRLNLQIESTGFEGRKQLEIVPAAVGMRRFSSHRYRLTALPTSRDRERSLATLVDVAERALQDAGALDADKYTVCRTLERFLQQDGGFTYTLASPPRTPGLDPVEDFIASSRTGNCEYFASALTLMLRSRGIPSRVVIGYQGGEWNAMGQYYQFRQLHAHSWVEAYLGPDEVGPYVRDPSRYPKGGWLRLDPTAVTLGAASQAETGMLNRMRQASDYLELVWVKYFVGMTSRRQQETLYRPVREAFYRLIDPATFVESLRLTLHRWIASFADGLRGNWFSWRGGLLAMVICLVGAGAYRSVRWTARLVGGLRRSGGSRGRMGGQVVPFYDRLERIFATIGVARAAGQTQREFAMSVAGHLAESPATRPHAALPRKIVDAFYAVRFGHRPLSGPEEQALNHELATLESILRQRPSQRS